MSNLPDAVKKRDFLYSSKKLSVEEIKKLALAFEQEGWLYDAIEYAKHCEDLELLARIRKMAVAEGNVFLLQKTYSKVSDVDATLLEECARQAEKSKKFRYALRAYQLLESEADVARLEAQLGLREGEGVHGASIS